MASLFAATPRSFAVTDSSVVLPPTALFYKEESGSRVESGWTNDPRSHAYLLTFSLPFLFSVCGPPAPRGARAA